MDGGTDSADGDRGFEFAISLRGSAALRQEGRTHSWEAWRRAEQPSQRLSEPLLQGRVALLICLAPLSELLDILAVQNGSMLLDQRSQ
jgi:hypothetical protein